MNKLITALFIGVFAVAVGAGTILADHFTFASTNEENTTKGWANVQVVDDTTAGEITLEFVSTRNFLSCFEYRTDGDETEATSPTNYNTQAHGLYPFKCIKNSSTEVTLEADEYVEVRMVFGGESDERFDWTRFDVTPVPVVEEPVVIEEPVVETPSYVAPRVASPVSTPLAPSVCVNTTVGKVGGIYVSRGVANDNAVEVRWWPAQGASQAHIIYTELNGNEWKHALLNTANDGVATISHLKNGGVYTFAVAGVNGCMVGDWSQSYAQRP